MARQYRTSTTIILETEGKMDIITCSTPVAGGLDLARSYVRYSTPNTHTVPFNHQSTPLHTC